MASSLQASYLHCWGAEAKHALASARGRPFVHIASHGFFYRPSAEQRRPTVILQEPNRDLDGISAVPVGDPLDAEDALDHAGLYLADSDASADTATIVTAREIANLDLRGTQLVVLSACDTGVGHIDLSEGVYGLRRAIAIAGAVTQVVSLWKISDEVTALLMDRYYASLRRGRGRCVAMRDAQQELLRDRRYEHPYHWAAFVTIGDDAPLEMPRES